MTPNEERKFLAKHYTRLRRELYGLVLRFNLAPENSDQWHALGRRCNDKRTDMQELHKAIAAKYPDMVKPTQHATR